MCRVRRLFLSWFSLKFSQFFSAFACPKNTRTSYIIEHDNYVTGGHLKITEFLFRMKTKFFISTVDGSSVSFSHFIMFFTSLTMFEPIIDLNDQQTIKELSEIAIISARKNVEHFGRFTLILSDFLRHEWNQLAHFILFSSFLATIYLPHRIRP